jgi:hypothetical protein
LWGAYPASDTGDPGWMVMGYTAQFGGGLSASIAAEERRLTQQINISATIPGAGAGTIAPGGFNTAVAGVTANAGAYGGFQSPDWVGNLRVDQTWGSAQLMAALHEVNSQYYGTTVSSGHPSDAWGFAVGGGAKFFVPAIGAGDYFQAQVNYTQGALRYVFFTPNTNWGKVAGFNEAYGVMSDGIYGGTIAAGNNTSVQLTTAWGVNAAYEHFWNKQWKTSAYGGYAAVTYNSNANAMLCSIEGSGGATGSIPAGNLTATNGCDNNWSTWWVGTRTQWNVSPDTYLAVDVLYSKQKTATFNANTGSLGNMAIANSGALFSADVDNWAARFRVHKDFYP